MGKDHQVAAGLDNINVLLVEDNKINQMVANALLEEIGANVSIANNGEEAISQWRSNNFDIVLMDIQMPIMDGYMAMRVIRDSSDSLKRQIPILAMTAHALESEGRRCQDSGADDLLMKPYNEEDFYFKIYQLVHNTTPDRGKA